MLELFSKDHQIDSRIEEVTLTPFGTDPVYTPPNPYVEYLLWPSYEDHFERLLTDNHGSHGKWKTCEHYTRTLSEPVAMRGSIITSKRYAGSDASVCKGEVKDPMALYYSSFGPPGKFNNDLPGFYVTRIDGGFVPQPSDLPLLEQRALSSMLPLMKAELSLINSVIELKDFAPLKRQIGSLASKIRSNPLHLNIINARVAARVAYATYRSMSLREAATRAVQLGANKYLQYAFAWAPLVSDILALRKAIRTFQRRLNDLITRAGRVQDRHFAFNWNEFPNPSYTAFDRESFSTKYWWAMTSSDFTRTVTYEPTQFHAQIRYNYNYTAYQREHARVLGLLDALGINLNPSIIWNAIPWSFVIDWVVNVNRALSAMSFANMEPQINILEYLWSVRRRRSISVARQTNYATFSTQFRDPNKVVLPIVTETAYRRQVKKLEAAQITASGLNLKEFSLGAALVVTRRRRSRQR